jgi:hypothetical protein
MIRKSLSLRAAAVALISVTATAAHAHERRGDPEVVIEWNQVLEGVLPAGGLAPPRNYAMVHIAMFDAINSITRTHRPYRTSVWAPWGASPEVAAAQAAQKAAAPPASRSAGAPFSVDLSVKELLANADARAVLVRHLGQAFLDGLPEVVRVFSPRQLSQHMSDTLTQDKLQALERDLAKVAIPR